jgi:protein-disulfide isomerase
MTPAPLRARRPAATLVAMPGLRLSRRARLVLLSTIIPIGVLVGLLLATRDSTSRAELRSAAADARALAALPQSGARLGRADAPVRIVEWADLQCPPCARSSRELVPQVVDRWVRPGRASLTLRTLTGIGPDSELGALGAHAAARQDRLWPFVGMLYVAQGAENSGWLTPYALRRAADGIPGLDLRRFEADLGSPATRAAVRDDRLAGASISTTPSFVVHGPRGTAVIAGLPSASRLAEAIAKADG